MLLPLGSWLYFPPSQHLFGQAWLCSALLLWPFAGRVFPLGLPWHPLVPASELALAVAEVEARTELDSLVPRSTGFLLQLLVGLGKLEKRPWAPRNIVGLFLVLNLGAGSRSELVAQSWGS